MRYLRTNTACRITVGPFFGTDGLTPATSLTVTNLKLTSTVDDANVPTLVLDTNPTASGGNNDMVHITNDDGGYYDLELTAANVNYLGRYHLSLSNAAACCPVFHEFMILPAVIYDSLVLGTDLFDVSVTQWLGVAVNTLKDLLGITAGPSTMASPGGHSTTQGSFAAGEGASARVGYLIWVPATRNLHRIKTLATDAWTVDSGDAFSADPAAASYYIIANPLNLPLVAADFDAGVGQAFADRLLARNQLGGADSSPTVKMALASGLLKIEISGATLTVKHGDGTTAFTRTISRAQADAIATIIE